MVEDRRRRLSAVLAADIVGYTTLVEQDIDGVVDAWRAARVELIDPTVARHGGRLVKLTGDGFLAEFSSVTEAVACAVSMQTGLAGGQLVFRMGLSLGDVLDDGEDIHGEGVNIAARLESLAEPGGLCVSGAVADSVRNRVDANFIDNGEHTVKHVSSPVRVWSWHPGGSRGLARTIPAASATSHAEAVLPYVIVEPFVGSGAPALAMELADEFQEELVTALSLRSGIRVLRQAPDDHSPGYVLQGKCRIRGERCRFSFTLLAADTLEVVHAGRLDGDLSRPDEFIEEASRRLSTELRQRTNIHFGASVHALSDDILDVQRLLAKAAYHMYRYRPSSTVTARASLERALALEPENPMAMSMLARCIAHMVPFGVEQVREGDAQRALELADSAIAVDPTMDFVFHARAWVRLWLEADHAGCISDGKRALGINPSYLQGRQDIAFAQIFSGSPRDGGDGLMDIIERAPSHPLVPLRLSLAALGKLLTGEYDQALEVAREGFDRQLAMPVHALIYAVALVSQGGPDAAATARHVLRQPQLPASDTRFLPFADEKQAAWFDNLVARV